MKNLVIKSVLVFVLGMSQIAVFAQENLKQTTNEVKNWFSDNWQWITGIGVVLIVLIVTFSGKRSNRKTTTIVKDDYGNIKSVTSTEVRS